MTAQLIDGKVVAGKVKMGVKKEVVELIKGLRQPFLYLDGYLEKLAWLKTKLMDAMLNPVQ